MGRSPEISCPYESVILGGDNYVPLSPSKQPTEKSSQPKPDKTQEKGD